MDGKTIAVVTGALWLLCGAMTNTEARSKGKQQRVLEIYRYAADPTLQEDDRTRERLDTGSPFGVYSPQTYFVVLRLLPGERVVAVRGRVRGGFRCTPRRRHSGSATGRALAKVGYRLAVGQLAPELREGAAMLGSLMMPHSEATDVISPKLTTDFVLREADLEQGEGYAGAFILLATNSTTRLTFPKITVRVRTPDGKERKRRRQARAVMVPGPEQPDASREDLVKILLDHASQSR